MLTFDLLAHIGVVNPAIAVAYDLVAALDASCGQFGSLLQRSGDAEDACLYREGAKNIQQAPGAATAAKFEHRLDERRTLSQFCAHADIVEHALGQIVAVRERRLAASFNIEIEIHRDRGPPGPGRVRRKLAIADEVAGDHWIGFRLIHCRILASRLTGVAPAISQAEEALLRRGRSNRTRRFQWGRASSCSRSRYAAPPRRAGFDWPRTSEMLRRDRQMSQGSG